MKHSPLNFCFAYQGGAYIPAAIGSAAYTVATINNSFDRNLHGLLGFLDSPVSLTSFIATSFSSLDIHVLSSEIFDSARERLDIYLT